MIYHPLRRKSLSFLYFVIAFFGFLLNSCTRYYYKPNGVITPMLADKGDVHLSATLKVDELFGPDDMFNYQVAASPLKHLGMIGGISRYSYTASRYDTIVGDVNSDALLGEFGLGTYTKLKEGTVGSKVIADFYGGVGFATIRGNVDMNLTRYFMQSGITFRSYYFDASFNMRFTGLQYRNFEANGLSEEYLRDQRLLTGRHIRIDKPFHVFAEPSATMRSGYRFVKFQFQFVYAVPTTKVPWHYRELTSTFGVTFDIEAYRKRKER